MQATNHVLYFGSPRMLLTLGLLSILMIDIFVSLLVPIAFISKHALAELQRSLVKMRNEN